MSSASVSGKAIDIPILKRVFAFITPYKRVFYISVGLTLLLTVISPIRPLLVQYAIDHYVIIPDAHGLLRITLVMIGLLLFQTLIQYYHTYLINWLGLAVVKDLRVQLFRHILNFR